MFWRPTHGPRFWALALALVALGVGGAGWWMISLNSRGHEAQQHLLATRDALSGSAASGVLDQGGSNGAVGDRQAAVAQLSSACNEAALADAELRDLGGQMQAVMPLVDALGAVPGVGTRTRAQTAALETGIQLAAAGTALCSGVQPLAELFAPSETDAAAAPGFARGALRTMLAARPQLVEAADRLDRTLASVSNIPEDELDGSTQAGLAALRTRLPAVVQTLRDTTALLDLLGAQGERHFLLVSQNPDELRATGGYIGSAGLVLVSDGSVRLLEYGSSRAYDTPAGQRASTPEPYNTYLGDYWELAGANWWASFPDVARQLAYFYTLSRPDQHLDGVVALDQVGLARLLEVLGPVDVPEYSERVSAADLQAALDRHVHAGYYSDENGRKQFTAALAGAVLEEVLAAPRPLVPSLVRAMRSALDQQHLLVSVWDSAAASVLARRHWDGALLPAPKDALLVVDTELVASKQSQAINRDIAYQVDLSSPDSPRAEATLTYANHSQPVANVAYVADYRTFVRVYAPGGAVLTASQGFSSEVTTQQECGRSVFGGEVLIPRDNTVQASLAYRLPPSVATDGGYDLLVQQQPGAPAGRLSVAVHGLVGVAASTQRDITPGHPYRWQMAPGAGNDLHEAALPDASPGGCAMPLVTAAPIAAPAWLEIPAARIAAPVVDLGVQPDGAMEAPATPDVVGWYRMSARAGQPGNSVFAGHVDWGQNTAVFWGLRDLVPNDLILLRGSDGVQHRYIVEWNRVFSRTDTAASDLVRGSKGSLLTLITCDGMYDRSTKDYSGRRIVRAVLGD